MCRNLGPPGVSRNLPVIQRVRRMLQIYYYFLGNFRAFAFTCIVLVWTGFKNSQLIIPSFKILIHFTFYI